MNNSKPILFLYDDYRQLNRILSSMLDYCSINSLTTYYDNFKTNDSTFEYINIKDLDKIINGIVPNKKVFLLVKNPEICLMYKYEDKARNGMSKYYTVDLDSGITKQIDSFGFKVMCSIKKDLEILELNNITKIEILNFYEKINNNMKILDEKSNVKWLNELKTNGKSDIRSDFNKRINRMFEDDSNMFNSY